MKANQASQEISNIGKDNVSKNPLDAAKKKLSLWSLFIFNTKFSRPVTRFYLGYTFGADLHARKISFCILNYSENSSNRYEASTMSLFFYNV